MRGLIGVMALILWGHMSPAAAQARKPAAAPAQRSDPNARRSENAPDGASDNPPKAKQQLNPARELERFQNMSPEEREKAMARLRPAQRERMERLLERFENMPPAQRERALRRLEELHNLSLDRRRAVTQELRNLRSLPPSERRNRLESDEIQRNFSPEERQILDESVGPRRRP